jgi:hypothetical protein
MRPYRYRCIATALHAEIFIVNSMFIDFSFEKLHVGNTLRKMDILSWFYVTLSEIRRFIMEIMWTILCFKIACAQIHKMRSH